MKSFFEALSVSVFAVLAACDGGGDAVAERIAAQEDKTITSTIPVERGYAPVNGLNMYYEIHGAGGTPLILLHGGASTIDTSFGKVLPSLAKTRQVIAVELQGHGHTADIDRPLTFEQDADDVAALLRHLSIKSADFFGYSNGGNTALRIAFRHPELVRKLVIASAFINNNGLYPEIRESFFKPATPDNVPADLRDAYNKGGAASGTVAHAGQ